MAASNNCLNKVCRTCLSTVHKLKSFDEHEDLIEMLTQWTPLKPKKDDMLPKQMCVVCIMKINMVHNFMKMCKKSESDIIQAIEENNQTLLNQFQSTQTEEMIDSNSSHDGSDSDSNSLTSTLPPDDMLEIVEHEIETNDETKDMINVEEEKMEIRIVESETVPENEIVPEYTNFEGFHHNEIKSTNINLAKYTETFQTSNSNKSGHGTFFDSIKYKCYLTENRLNSNTDKLPNINTLEFSTLNDDAHALCKIRIEVLRKIIEDLYFKQDELNSLNSNCQKYFLQQKKNHQNVAEPAELPGNPGF